MYQNPLSKNYSSGCKNGSAGKNISCSPKELDFDSQPPHQVAPSHLRHQLLGNQYLYSDMHRDTHKHMRRSVVEASQAMPRGEQRSTAKVLTPHRRHIYAELNAPSLLYRAPNIMKAGWKQLSMFRLTWRPNHNLGMLSH